MDKLLLENLLLVLKSTVEVYVHGTLESSNEKVNEVLNDCLNVTLKLQHELFLKMEELGFYKLNNIDTKSIQKVLSNLES